VGCWSYGEEIRRKVKSVLTTNGRDGRETGVHFLSWQMAQVEVLVLGLLGQHLAQDGTRNHISWRKFGL
jgi:hypothetical protein